MLSYKYTGCQSSFCPTLISDGQFMVVFGPVLRREEMATERVRWAGGPGLVHAARTAVAGPGLFLGGGVFPLPEKVLGRSRPLGFTRPHSAPRLRLCVQRLCEMV